MQLNNHSYFSFRYGVMSPRDLLQYAQDMGIKELVLTDINSTSGCMNFIRLAPEYNIRPIIGVDFRDGIQQQFIAIAKNNEGFFEINRFLSTHLHRKTQIPSRAPDFQHAYVIYPFSTYKSDALKENEYIGIKPHELLKVSFSEWKYQQDKMCILQTTTFRHQSDFNIHRLLRSIDNNTLLSKLPKSEEGSVSDKILNQEQLLNKYEDYPDLIGNTQDILTNSNIHFDFGEGHPHKNLSTYTGSEQGDYEKLRSLALNGIAYRYKKVTIQILRRLANELDVIRKKKFISYFLINWDIISYALDKNFFYVGRGSGANSIIAYLLRITDVDPIELDLYFERFINLYRKSPPDFDIDFSWKDRDEITQYIFNRFGPERVCLLATYSTFQHKAILRELGKVFGLPPHELSQLSELKTKKVDSVTQLILKYAAKMQNIPSHLSIHAGGIIISDKPIHYYTATSLPPKGFQVTHFDMVVAEDIGLYKFDILSQRGLEKIKDALKIIKYNNPKDNEIDIHDVGKFFDDNKVKALLRNGRAIGCFYVESPAMRMLLTKLKADNYLGLVAASSVIRPGVAKSGMMREYIIRFRIPERRADANKILKELMPDTFGVMVYQEDVIKVAHYFAGLTLDEADILRRGMSGKFRSRDEFQIVRQQFFTNCQNLGREKSLTQDVWRQIESFAGYAFAKGHSASYAIESYQSLYLKAHYPLEYMVAVINNGGGFYNRELYVHEARMHGAIIEAPCVNKSQAKTVIYGKRVFLGFHLIQDIKEETITEIIHQRQLIGEFRSLERFIDQVKISLEQLKILIRIGAFRSSGVDKKALLWKAYFLLSGTKNKDSTISLFKTKKSNLQIPTFYQDYREDGFDEMEILNFSLISPFRLVKDTSAQSTITAQQIKSNNSKIVTLLGYLVTIKKTYTAKKQQNMYFGTFIDQEGNFIDTVHFPPVAYKYPFRGKGVYEITGKVVEEFDFYSIEVSSMEKVHYLNMEDDFELMVE